MGMLLVLQNVVLKFPGPSNNHTPKKLKKN